ncbi:receptor-type adenylate cyclase, putative, partial [Trypanosoma cruzi marinkellei]
MYITTHTVDCAGLFPHVFGGAFVADAHVFSAAVAETTDSSPFLCAPFSFPLRFSCRKPQATQQEILKAASMAVGWVAVWPREQRACAAARCLIVALLLFAPQLVVSNPCIPETNVKVLMLNVTDIPIDQKFVDSLEAGLESALWSRNFTVADGVHVKIIRKTATMQTSGVVIGKALNESSDILLVAGVIGDTTVANSLPVIMRHGLVSFSPFTSSSLVRGWNPNLYFLRAEPAAELLALLRYALAHLRVRRLGFMYLQGGYFGDREYAQAQRVMLGMGY